MSAPAARLGPHKPTGSDAPPLTRGAGRALHPCTVSCTPGRALHRGTVHRAPCTAHRAGRVKQGSLTNEDVLRSEIPWPSFQNAGIISKEQLEMVYLLDKQEGSAWG